MATKTEALIDEQAWQAIGLTLQLASLTTVLLLLLATPLAWWLAHTRSRLRAPISALVTLPLVLPPSVLGFYLLVALGPEGPLGRFTQAMGHKKKPLFALDKRKVARFPMTEISLKMIY